MTVSQLVANSSSEELTGWMALFALDAEADADG